MKKTLISHFVMSLMLVNLASEAMANDRNSRPNRGQGNTVTNPRPNAPTGTRPSRPTQRPNNGGGTLSQPHQPGSGGSGNPRPSRSNDNIQSNASALNTSSASRPSRPVAHPSRPVAHPSRPVYTSTPYRRPVAHPSRPVYTSTPYRRPVPTTYVRPTRHVRDWYAPSYGTPTWHTVRQPIPATYVYRHYVPARHYYGTYQYHRPLYWTYNNYHRPVFHQTPAYFSWNYSQNYHWRQTSTYYSYLLGSYPEYLYINWIYHPALGRHDGPQFIDGYYWYVHNGYKHRYSNVDSCNYQLVDTFTHQVTQSWWTQNCSRSYNTCAVTRDNFNRQQGAYRYDCVETIRDQRYNYSTPTYNYQVIDQGYVNDDLFQYDDVGYYDDQYNDYNYDYHY